MLRSLTRARVLFRSPLLLQTRQTSTAPSRSSEAYEDTYNDTYNEPYNDPYDDTYNDTYTPTVPLRPTTVSKRQQFLQTLINRQIPSITLSNGDSIPALGYQAYSHREGKPKVFQDLIWKGYRHIDMNSAFNNPHTYLQSSFWSLAHGVNRSDLYVSAKLDSWWHHDPKASLYHNLLGLKTGYLDLWIMRWPISWESRENHSEPPKDKTGREIDYIQAWKGMEEQLEAGKVKALGISNFSKAELDLLLQHAKHKPVVHQMEITPYLQQTEFVEYNRSLGIAPVATSPVGERALEGGPRYTSLLNDPTLLSIAEKHQITTRQLITAWHLNNSIITVPYLDSHSDALGNVQVDSLILPDEDLAAISSLERAQRIYKPRLLGYFPFSDLTDPDLMLESDELPTMATVITRRQKRIEAAKRRAEEDEAAMAAGEERFGTTTYAGTVFGWVRSVDGSRKAVDNKTGHFGPSLRLRKRKK
ncbi:hypothetical protein TWF281_009578 [Arthrobotrys megalospora]